MENSHQNKNGGILSKKISLNWVKKTEEEFDKISDSFGILPGVTGSIRLRNNLREKVGKLLIYKRNILEVGVGNGLMFKHLKQKIDYIGLDLSARMLSLAKKRAIKHSLSFYPVQGNATNLPFKDHSFDCTICIDTLHHVPSQLTEQVIDELVRVTKVDGQILLEVKNKLNLIVCYLYWEAQKKGALIMHPVNPIIIRRYIEKKNLKIKAHFIGPGYWLAPFVLFDIRRLDK